MVSINTWKTSSTYSFVMHKMLRNAKLVGFCRMNSVPLKFFTMTHGPQLCPLPMNAVPPNVATCLRFIREFANLFPWMSKMSNRKQAPPPPLCECLAFPNGTGFSLFLLDCAICLRVSSSILSRNRHTSQMFSWMLIFKVPLHTSLSLNACTSIALGNQIE